MDFKHFPDPSRESKSNIVGALTTDKKQKPARHNNPTVSNLGHDKPKDNFKKSKKHNRYISDRINYDKPTGKTSAEKNMDRGKIAIDYDTRAKSLERARKPKHKQTYNTNFYKKKEALKNPHTFQVAEKVKSLKSFQNHGGSNNSTLSSNCELQHQNTSNRVLTNNEKNSLVSDECFMEIKPPKTPLFPKNKDEFIEPSRIVTKDASLSNTKSKVNTYNTHRPETIGKAKEKTDSKLIKSAFENKNDHHAVNKAEEPSIPQKDMKIVRRHPISPNDTDLPVTFTETDKKLDFFATSLQDSEANGLLSLEYQYINPNALNQDDYSKNDISYFHNLSTLDNPLRYNNFKEIEKYFVLESKDNLPFSENIFDSNYGSATAFTEFSTLNLGEFGLDFSLSLNQNLETEMSLSDAFFYSFEDANNNIDNWCDKKINKVTSPNQLLKNKEEAEFVLSVTMENLAAAGKLDEFDYKNQINLRPEATIAKEKNLPVATDDKYLNVKNREKAKSGVVKFSTKSERQNLWASDYLNSCIRKFDDHSGGLVSANKVYSKGPLLSNNNITNSGLAPNTNSIKPGIITRSEGSVLIPSTKIVEEKQQNSKNISSINRVIDNERQNVLKVNQNSEVELAAMNSMNLNEQVTNKSDDYNLTSNNQMVAFKNQKEFGLIKNSSLMEGENRLGRPTRSQKQVTPNYPQMLVPLIFNYFTERFKTGKVFKKRIYNTDYSHELKAFIQERKLNHQLAISEFVEHLAVKNLPKTPKMNALKIRKDIRIIKFLNNWHIETPLKDNDFSKTLIPRLSKTRNDSNILERKMADLEIVSTEYCCSEKEASITRQPIDVNKSTFFSKVDGLVEIKCAKVRNSSTTASNDFIAKQTNPVQSAKAVCKTGKRIKENKKNGGNTVQSGNWEYQQLQNKKKRNHEKCVTEPKKDDSTTQVQASGKRRGWFTMTVRQNNNAGNGKNLANCSEQSRLNPIYGVGEYTLAAVTSNSVPNVAFSSETDFRSSPTRAKSSPLREKNQNLVIYAGTMNKSGNAKIRQKGDNYNFPINTKTTPMSEPSARLDEIVDPGKSWKRQEIPTGSLSTGNLRDWISNRKRGSFSNIAESKILYEAANKFDSGSGNGCNHLLSSLEIELDNEKKYSSSTSQKGKEFQTSPLNKTRRSKVSTEIESRKDSSAHASSNLDSCFDETGDFLASFNAKTLEVWSKTIQKSAPWKVETHEEVCTNGWKFEEGPLSPSRNVSRSASFNQGSVASDYEKPMSYLDDDIFGNVFDESINSTMSFLEDFAKRGFDAIDERSWQNTPINDKDSILYDMCKDWKEVQRPRELKSGSRTNSFAGSSRYDKKVDYNDDQGNYYFSDFDFDGYGSMSEQKLPSSANVLVDTNGQLGQVSTCIHHDVTSEDGNDNETMSRKIDKDSKEKKFGRKNDYRKKQLHVVPKKEVEFTIMTNTNSTNKAKWWRRAGTKEKQEASNINEKKSDTIIEVNPRNSSRQKAFDTRSLFKDAFSNVRDKLKF